jgi:hypothetical protein
MTTRAGKWFSKQLGGDVDDDGTVRPGDNDPVVIFTGIPERARGVKAHLETAGFSITTNARVADPRVLAADMGVSPKPSLVNLEIRAGDFERAMLVLNRPASAETTPVIKRRR